MLDGKSVLAAVEARRHQDGLTQENVAAGCGITQGHYSKMVSGQVPVGKRAATLLEAWLAEAPGRSQVGAQGGLAAMRLAASIQRDCRRLASMIGAGGAGVTRNGGTARPAGELKRT